MRLTGIWKMSTGTGMGGIGCNKDVSFNSYGRCVSGPVRVELDAIMSFHMEDVYRDRYGWNWMQ
jgi:hypothetical protein